MLVFKYYSRSVNLYGYEGLWTISHEYTSFHDLILGTEVAIIYSLGVPIICNNKLTFTSFPSASLDQVKCGHKIPPLGRNLFRNRLLKQNLLACDHPKLVKRCLLGSSCVWYFWPSQVRAISMRNNLRLFKLIAFSTTVRL